MRVTSTVLDGIGGGLLARHHSLSTRPPVLSSYIPLVSLYGTVRILHFLAKISTLPTFTTGLLPSDVGRKVPPKGIN